MKIQLIENLMRPWLEKGTVGGIGFGLMVLGPVIFGAAFSIGWLMWTGIGLYGLLVFYIIISGLTRGRNKE